MNIKFPSNVKESFQTFHSISEFNMFEVDQIVQDFLVIETQQDFDLDSKFEDFGYQHLSILRNLGTHLILLFGIVMVALTTVLLKSIKRKSIL